MSDRNSSATGLKPLELREPERVNEAGTAHSENGYGVQRAAGALPSVAVSTLEPMEVAQSLPQILPENSPLKYDRRNQQMVLRNGVDVRKAEATLATYVELEAVATSEHVAEVMDGLWAHYTSRTQDGDNQRLVARDWMRKLVGKPVGKVYRTYDKIISTKRYGRPTLGDFLEVYREVEVSWNAEISLLKGVISREKRGAQS